MLPSQAPGTAGLPSDRDERELQRFGYRQELNRTLGYFSSFPLSFSVICITSGLFANYGDGLPAAGPAFVWTWLIVGAGQFLVAMVFAQLARQIPLSGYAYQWTRALAGPRLAWWAGWIMIVRFVTGMAGVAYALASYLVPFFGFQTSSRNIVIATVATLVLAALINHFGIRLASLVNDFSVIAEILSTVVIGFLLCIQPKKRPWNSFPRVPALDQSPNLSAARAFAFAASSSRFFGGAFVSSADNRRIEALAISSIAPLNAASFAFDGLLNPVIFRTNCSEAARTSSGVTGGSKLNSVFIFLHMRNSLQKS
jgi:amino acid transporter